MLPLTKNLDNFIFLRGNAFNKLEIDEIEQQIGGKVVKDSENLLILNLDYELFQYRKKNNINPNVIMINTYPEYVFVFIVPRLPVKDVNPFINNPIWFKIKRNKLFKTG